MGSITVRIDDELKAQAEAELAQLGVSHTDVIIGIYRYIIQHHRLPHSEDDTYLALMKKRLLELTRLVEAMQRNLQKNGHISTSARDAVVALLDRFGIELDANYEAMKRASEGYLPSAWTEALQAAKGLSYLLTLTSVKRDKLSGLEFRNSKEIDKAVLHLISSNEFINGEKK